MGLTELANWWNGAPLLSEPDVRPSATGLTHIQPLLRDSSK
jgi:hypothetical protein